MAYLLHTNCIADTIKPANGSVFTLEELQSFVGGYIEIVPIGSTHLLVIDEEGKLKGKPINEAATLHARRNGCIAPDDVIVGDALFCDNIEVD